MGKRKIEMEKAPRLFLNFPYFIVLSTAQCATKSPYLVSRLAIQGKKPPDLSSSLAPNFILSAQRDQL